MSIFWIVVAILAGILLAIADHYRFERKLDKCENARLDLDAEIEKLNKRHNFNQTMKVDNSTTKEK